MEPYKKNNEVKNFYHGAIRCILQVKGREERAMFYNIPNIDAFISKITARCVGKIVRSKDTTLSKDSGSRDFKVQKLEHHN